MLSEAAFSRAIVTMSEWKDPEGETPAGAPATAAAPPPRLGDHSAYMPEPMLLLADVHIKVRGGSTLPAHALKLVENCGALACSSELFADATSKAPAALSAPFDEYAEADVARFLRCICVAAGAELPSEDAARPAVVRLAHALDAAAVVAAARVRLVQVLGRATFAEVAETEELAVLCGWDDVRVETVKSLVATLQAPAGAHAETLALMSDIKAISLARAMIDGLPAELAASAFGTLTANFRRLSHTASQEARNAALLGPAAAKSALIGARGDAFEIDGRFAAVIAVHDFSDARPESVAAFKSRGLEWEIVLQPNGTQYDASGKPAFTLALLGGWPKKVRWSYGFIKSNLGRRPSATWECEEFEDVLTKFATEPTSSTNMTPASFRADWVHLGVAAPFVRIVDVTDPTPEEVAAADAEAEDEDASEDEVENEAGM